MSNASLLVHFKEGKFHLSANGVHLAIHSMKHLWAMASTGKVLDLQCSSLRVMKGGDCSEEGFWGRKKR